jgi:hypothetical protein
MDTAVVIVVALITLAVIIGAVIYVQRRRSQDLRARYGSEYIAAVDELGDRHKAEAELRQRERRVERFDIRPLSAGETERFAERWRKVQADFVDDPGAATARADELLGEVMHARGYPVSDFEQRAADLSVEHPQLVADYRIAHEVAMRHARGDAGTEDLRRAMIHYRDLFAELVELPPPEARRAQEARTFREEPEDGRAARVRDEEEERRADDRAARERRTDDRPGRRPGRGRAPLV